MSILFLILKIIGILILIPIVFILILLIFPICYQMEGEFDGKNTKGMAKVSWAVLFLRAGVFYEEELNYGIRIFGIPVYDSRKDHWSVFGKSSEEKKQKPKKQKEKKKSKPKDSTSKEKTRKEVPKERPSERSEDVLEISWDEKDESKEKKQPSSKPEEEKEFFGKKIVNLIKKCYNKCKSLFKKITAVLDKMELVGDLFLDEEIIDAVKRVKGYGIDGIKLLLPQKLEAQITFGFEDPYYTGKVLGMAALLIPIYGEHVDITPDFKQQILKGKIKIKGSIRRYKILLFLWRIYKDKDNLLKQKDRALAMIGGN